MSINGEFFMVIGVTGGIACGKTTVSKVFQNLGATVIDLDSMGHQLLRDDPLVYERLVYSFGCGILNEKGEIDRKKLARLVFDNPDYLNALNSIVHPILIKRTAEMVKQEIARDKFKTVVLDAVLLIECNMTGMVDSVVLVHADEYKQLQRLTKRGLSRDDSYKRIRSQMTFNEKKSFADYIIYTNGSLDNTTKQAKKVWNNLKMKKNLDV
jgi:dephospho-CoA kinase